MQITINTADDERRTFEMLTWFDLVAPPPKPRRRPSVSAGSGWQLLQSPLPKPGKSPQERCRYPGGFSRAIAGPWVTAGRLAMKTFLNIFFKLLIQRPERATLGLKLYGCSAQGNKKPDSLGRN